jgi:hypothetical protein
MGIATLFVVNLHLVSAQDLSKPSTFEIGFQFSTTSIGPSASSARLSDFAALPQSHFEPAVGGRFAFNVNKYFALESATNFFPRRLSTGGHVFQEQFGAKVGRRFKRMGVFAKIRPGFVSFSEFATESGTQTIGLPPLQFTVARIVPQRRYFFSMDVGGVGEFYVSCRILVRVDAGDTIIRYGKGLFYDFDETTPQSPGQTKHNLQLSAGVAFRFK